MRKKPVKTKKTTPWKLDYPAWSTAVMFGIAPTYPRTGQYDLIHRDGITRTYALKGDYIHFGIDTISIVKVRQA